ncbi:MAG: exodeoxyribonuclease VII large subunit [Bacilli bacterium]|nr:exodeoxyribonuclease VII large subunit [Bacilli bacterium]MDD3305386.1 exodeoxyribonuclease VII large subunit [Bacilli bacterium]MDD4054043.1 exodeoxyribonuclease VII large subunit [Bacilli bacterium]MDD4411825.1 exodeoxyribonuclease VII large subunit [Bacilli bacterium]
MEELNKYLSITALTRYLKYKFDSDDHLRNIYLKGEISNFKSHSRGHFYFTLKDETSRISAIMFSSNTSKLIFKPEDGMKVLVRGKVSIYEPTGNYQIYVEEMLEDGVGNLYIAFEQLKAKLEKEGLFDVSHKKFLPTIPKRIGIVTAPTGAAIKDILSTLKRRFPISETILFPTLVQGDAAHTNIVKQIKKAEEFNLDLLIIGRGGGSIEDLWPFNEEDVARAIYNCKIPTISAVGHEVDFTISDFVADVRAATPTGAAEIAVPNMIDLINHIDNFKIRYNKVILNKIDSLKMLLHKLKDSYILNNPIHIYEVKEQLLDNYIEKANTLILNIIDKRKDTLIHLKDSYILNNPDKLFEKPKNNLTKYIEKLEVLNPMNTLKRGYTIVKKEDIAIDNIKKLKVNDNINIIFNKGIVKANIIEIKES